MLPTPKTVMRVVDTQATAGETNTSVIDRLGFDYAVIAIGLQGLEATTAPAVVKLQESADTNASNYADVTGFVGGTSFTLPTAVRTLGNTSGPTIIQMGVDLRARKRYLRTSISVGTHGAVVQNATLYRGDEAPFSAGTAGVDVLVRG